MLITSGLQRLRRFGEFKEFSAVLECLSDKGNALLRAMEPPAHDDFEPARLSTLQSQRVGRIALRELADWVREMLQRHAQDPVAEVTEIDELAEFFGDDEESNDKGGRDGDENPRGALKIRARPLPKRKQSVSSDEDGNVADGGGGTGESGDDDDIDGEGDGRNEGGGGGGGGGDSNDSDRGNKSSGGSGGGKASATSTLSLRNVRAVVISPSKRTIAFTPQSTGKVKVELEDSGADTNRLLKIKSASSGEVTDGRVTVTCVANARAKIDVELERSFDGTIRIKGNAV